MIHPHSSGSRLCFEVIDDKWMHFFDYLAPVGQICVVLGQCAPNYMDWFYMILHPFMRPTQPGDPPRHPLVMQDETYVESDMPEYPVATAAMEEAPTHASSDVEQPRHAVVKYIFHSFLNFI